MKRAEDRFAVWSRSARTERGWSQRELADRLAEKGIKLDPTAITRLEKGQRPIRLDEAAAIAEIFGALDHVQYIAELEARIAEAVRVLGGSS